MATENVDFYIVKSGDTLTGIAAKTGHSVASLVKLNAVKTPDKIKVGQVFYLNEKTAFAVKGLFLDALRHPIENLVYKLVLDGKVQTGKTGKNGQTAEHVTKSAKSKVEIHVQDLQGNWQQLASTVSGYGKKLVTAVSPYLMFNDQLEPHPPAAPTTPTPRKKPPVPAHPRQQPPLPPTPKGPPSKNNPKVKPHKTKGKHGESVVQIGVEIPKELLNLFAGYKDQPISEGMWADEASVLVCEKAVLKAFAQVETKAAAFKRVNATNGAMIPTILYERQVFSRLTHGRYDKDYPDLSGPARLRYGLDSAQYLRLINAYSLDPDAALESCSWGAFQIMGESYSLCGSDDVRGFVAQVAGSAAAQISLLSNFIRNKAGGKLHLAVQNKDWKRIAIYYNGMVKNKKTGKKEIREHYDKRLEEAYNEIKNSKNS